MANLRDIRKRRRSAASTRKITRTMELVASSKLQKAMQAAVAAKPYAAALHDLLGKLHAASGGRAGHPLMTVRPVKRVLILLATSDRGLAGAFNVNLTALAVRRAREWEAQGATVQFVALGRKAASTLRFSGYEAVEVHQKLTGGVLPFARIEPIADKATAGFLAGEHDHVEVVYASFISQVRQVPDHFVLLPAGSGSRPAADAPRTHHDDFEFIPSPEELYAALVPQVAKATLYAALLQTTAAEHAARRVAMKNASDAAGDMVRDLTRVYNRGRQGKITQEIAEITGAVEAMA